MGERIPKLKKLFETSTKLKTARTCKENFKLIKQSLSYRLSFYSYLRQIINVICSFSISYLVWQVIILMYRLSSCFQSCLTGCDLVWQGMILSDRFLSYSLSCFTGYRHVSLWCKQSRRAHHPARWRHQRALHRQWKLVDGRTGRREAGLLSVELRNATRWVFNVLLTSTPERELLR